MPCRATIRVNGTAHVLDVEARALLVDVLRDDLHLTGTHVGCDTSQCGACTVLLDGRAVKSCSVLAVQADGHDVVTIEGFAGSAGGPKGSLHPMQEAFRDHHGLQCGFCTPGMILAGAEVVARNARPNDGQIRDGLRGNLCRCTGYHNIVEAVRAAGERIAAGAAKPAGAAAASREGAS